MRANGTECWKVDEVVDLSDGRESLRDRLKRRWLMPRWVDVVGGDYVDPCKSRGYGGAGVVDV